MSMKTMRILKIILSCNYTCSICFGEHALFNYWLLIIHEKMVSINYKLDNVCNQVFTVFLINLHVLRRD